LSDFVLNPEEATVPLSTIKNLATLSEHPLIDLIILSGRPLSFLQKRFPKSFKLAGEYGSKTNFTDNELKKESLPDKTQAKLLELVKIHPHSHIEKKDHSWVWHYRRIKESLSEEKIQHLMTKLSQTLSHSSYSVYHYNCVLEIKRSDISKASFVQSHVQHNPDHIFIAFGDDIADQSFFEMIPKNQGWVCAVGDVITKADYYFKAPENLRSFILHLKEQLQMQEPLPC
tara:strand:+ start:4640 stop:5326 length:687 start_codon:yes stop_codon:yes gene_type:complete